MTLAPQDELWLCSLHYNIKYWALYTVQFLQLNEFPHCQKSVWSFGQMGAFSKQNFGSIHVGLSHGLNDGFLM